MVELKTLIGIALPLAKIIDEKSCYGRGNLAYAGSV